LARNDFKAIKVIAHRMKGHSKGYGIEALSEISTRLEISAAQEDPTTTEYYVKNLKQVLI